MTSIRMSMVAFVWFYCVVWFLIQDVTKVAVYGLLWDADLECARSEYEAQLVRAKDLHTSREDAKWEKVSEPPASSNRPLRKTGLARSLGTCAVEQTWEQVGLFAT